MSLPLIPEWHLFQNDPFSGMRLVPECTRTTDSRAGCFDPEGLISALLVLWQAEHKNVCPAWMPHFCEASVEAPCHARILTENCWFEFFRTFCSTTTRHTTFTRSRQVGLLQVSWPVTVDHQTKLTVSFVWWSTVTGHETWAKPTALLLVITTDLPSVTAGNTMLFLLKTLNLWIWLLRIEGSSERSQKPVVCAALGKSCFKNMATGIDWTCRKAQATHEKFQEMC